MAEILTESFCERCGSRYTFESEVPRARLRGVRVLSRGLKNFVLDDKTSMDEALAAARDDTDRALTSHQLEAFHKTFNFCMQCRQYICPDCWNDADGRCLTCAPMLGHGILTAPFSNLDPSAGIAAADQDGLAAAAMNGHKHVSDQPTPPPAEMIGTSEVQALAEAAEADAVEATLAEAASDPFATAEAADMFDLEALAPSEPAAAVSEDPGAAPEILIQADTVDAVPEAIVEVEDPIAAAALPTEPEYDVIAEPAAAAPPEADVVGEIAADSDDVGDTHQSSTTATAEQTSLLLAGLRPGESLDDAIAAFESLPSVVAELEALELGSVEAATTDDLPATPEPPVLVDALDDTPAVPDGVTIADGAESADATWVPDEEPLVDVPVVAEAAQPEPVSYVEPLDEIPTGQPESPEPVTHELAAPEPTVEPVVVQAQPEPAAPSIPEPSEIAAAAAADIVDQPTWSIVAPNPATITEVPGPIADPAIEPPAAPPAQAVPAQNQEPSWPAQPEWPSPLPSSGLPFLGRPVVPTGGVNALWAESDRAVSAPSAGTDKPAGGVQPCVSCGLSLSASARFCRRCGTSQVG